VIISVDIIILSLVSGLRLVKLIHVNLLHLKNLFVKIIFGDLIAL